ncbi:RNA polymerase sigma factor [Cohnella caldifontis]|uniref:RNA polymerase sigma factor n=1 Tax=Cohnella caldifontis TaxID=3027471 RepID=UPI0023EE26A9|nr:sigma-70 family RNA polymerase sigma factor [Cohnella sp. YIM B05605]
MNARTEARLSELYAAHAPALNGCMFRLTGNREDAADLVQEAFLRLCQQERLPEYPLAWLSRTGYRLFVDRLRRARRIVWVPLDPALPGSSGPEQAVLDTEAERQANRLLQRLHPQVREAFEMRIYGEFSYGEIACRLGCSENTVKTWIRRGKAKLSGWR